MPRLSEFMEEIAVVVERIPRSGNAGVFLRHRGNATIENSPGHEDRFSVFLESHETIQGFGREEQKQLEAFIEIRLEHFPRGADDERARVIAEDLERIVDVIEAKDDWGQGSGGAVDLVQHDPRGRTDRTDPNWWKTPMIFRCIVWSPSWRA